MNLRRAHFENEDKKIDEFLNKYKSINTVPYFLGNDFFDVAMKQMSTRQRNQNRIGKVTGLHESKAKASISGLKLDPIPIIAHEPIPMPIFDEIRVEAKPVEIPKILEPLPSKSESFKRKVEVEAKPAEIPKILEPLPSKSESLKRKVEAKLDHKEIDKPTPYEVKSIDANDPRYVKILKSIDTPKVETKPTVNETEPEIKKNTPYKKLIVANDSSDEKILKSIETKKVEEPKVFDKEKFDSFADTRREIKQLEGDLAKNPKQEKIIDRMKTILERRSEMKGEDKEFQILSLEYEILKNAKQIQFTVPTIANTKRNMENALLKKDAVYSEHTKAILTNTLKLITIYENLTKSMDK